MRGDVDILTVVRTAIQDLRERVRTGAVEILANDDCEPNRLLVGSGWVKGLQDAVDGFEKAINSMTNEDEEEEM